MLQYLAFHKIKIALWAMLIAALQVFTYFSVSYLEQQQVEADRLLYAERIQAQIKQSITEKQQATTAIALVLSGQLNDGHITLDRLITEKFDRVINRINYYSDYKNLWVQIVDANGRSIYRNWSDIREDLSKVRPEFENFSQVDQPVVSISSGRFDLSIKVVAPIFNANRLVGFVDLISHFNSIQLRFEEQDIDTLVVATPERSALIQHPFSKHKIENYYVANLNPNRDLIKKVTPSLMQAWQQAPYSIWQNYLVVAYPLEASNGEIHGHVYSFSPLEKVHSITSDELSPSKIEEWLIEADIFLTLLILVSLGLVLISRQKQYFKNVLNAENELVLVTNGYRLIDGNTQLFHYFPSLKEGEEDCVCDFFIDEPGFVTKYYHGKIWLEYLLDNPNKTHKAKISMGNKTVIFQLKAKRFDDQNSLAVVVLSDITELEGLNRRLVRQNQVDELTRAGNRRYFNQQIEKAFTSAKTEASPLSLILFDIDHFKKVNDTYGHACGDVVLQQVSDTVFDVMDHQKVFYRIGGEEFAVVLENTSLEVAVEIAEKIRSKVEASRFHQAPNVTVSLGVGQFSVSEDDDVSKFIARIDTLQYSAKHNGRNRVEH